MKAFNDSVIYFIVVDRFFNSDPANDAGRNPAATDLTRKDWFKYWGGDLGGVLAKLDYLKELGAGAVWLTPLFEQARGLVDAEGRGIAAYHGYWARDFKRLDEHLISDPADARMFASGATIVDRLSKAMRSKEMKLIFDIVCNHSSPPGSAEGGKVSKGELYDDGLLLTSYDNDSLGWYHRNGTVSDWNDAAQVENGELCGLADFDESRIGYRTYIKDVMKLWVDKGADGLRVDTVKHMPLWFWQEFVSDLLAHKPGLFIFGEWFQGGCNDPASVHFANKSGMGMLDFSLQRGLEDCLARNLYRGFFMVDEVFKKDRLLDDCHRLVTFIDNHDMPRFLSSGATPRRLELALALILTCRGTPCIYYGTEQYLNDPTNGGVDPYNRPMMKDWNTSTPAFRLIKALSAVRKENRAVQRGSQRVKYLSEDLYAFTRVYRSSAALTVLNKGPKTALSLKNLEFPDGVYKDALSGRSARVSGGMIEGLQLGADTAMVFSHPGEARRRGGLTVGFMLNGLETVYGQSVKVIGNCPELGCWDVDKAFPLEYVNENLWMGDLDLAESAGREITYKFIAAGPDGAMLYEDRPAHARRLPAEGYVIHQHRWS
ncbi:MAG: alpha-amylase family glycosyl hydrolase [Elusimicrobiales bacterium]|jgi:cyclomaltodextrin glucanotransferase